MPPLKDPVTGKFIKSSDTPASPSTDVPTGNEPSPEPPAEKEPLDLSGAKALVESFLGDKPATPPEKKKTKAAAKPDEKPEGEKTDAKPAAAKPDVPKDKPDVRPKSKPTAAAAPALTTDQISALAEGVARGLQKPDKKDDAGAAPKDEPWLSDSDKRKIPVLEQMEKLYPDRYKGIAGKFKTSKKALTDYAAKWQAEHPGQEFDETAEEHEQFLDSIDIDWDDEDYVEAVAEIRTSAKVAETQKQSDQKLSAIERREKLREAQPLIYAESNKAARTFWKHMGDTFAVLMDENGNFDAAKAKAIADADPVTFGIRLDAAKALDAEVSELYKLMGVPGLTDENGEPATTALVDFDAKNQIHVNLDKFAAEQENKMRKLSAEDQRDAEGRAFLPYAEYYKVPLKERARYWTFTAGDLAALRAKDLADTAQKIITQEEEKYRKWAKARGINIESASEKPKQAAAEEPEVETVGAVEKPASPSGGVESKLAASKSAGKPLPAAGASAFVSRMFS